MESIDLEIYPILAQACKRTHDLARTSPIPLGIIMGINDHGVNNNHIKSLEYANCLMMETIEGSHDCLWGNAKTFNKLLDDFIDQIHNISS